MTTTATRERPRLGGPDPAILALPFFQPRHAELVERVSGWCVEHRDVSR